MACGEKGVYGRGMGRVRSKAEPWNERRVTDVTLGAKGDNGNRRSWARQSSGALRCHIPKSDDFGDGFRLKAVLETCCVEVG